MAGASKERRFRNARRVFFAVAILFGLLVAALRIFSTAPIVHRLTFMPSALPPEHQDPGVWGANASQLWIPGEDGSRLHAWWFAPTDPRPRASCAVIVHTHGNAGNIASRRNLAEELAQLGHGTLLFDYRGYGASEGVPSERGLYADAGSVMEHLVQEWGVAPERIVLLSHSLGSAVATEVAKSHRVGALVLGAPFTDLPAAARSKLKLVPRVLLDWEEGRFDALEDMPDILSPVLVGLGSRDRLVTRRVAQQLYEAARPPKKWVTIEGADHNGMFTPQFLQTVDGFIRTQLRCAQ